MAAKASTRRRGTAVRILVYDGRGFWLAPKRLEESVFKLPRAEGAGQALELRATECVPQL